MSRPNDLLNPLYKESGPPTDPISQFIKGELPSTDPVSQVALNPQPQPPGSTGAQDPGPIQVNKGAADPGPISINSGAADPGPIQVNRGDAEPGPISKPAGLSGGGLNRGVLGAIIVVCLIALLLGGGFALHSVTQHVESNHVSADPGVIQRQQQVLVASHSSSGAGGGHAGGLTGLASCSLDAASSPDTLVERLIGGGYTADGDSSGALHIKSLAPLSNNKGTLTWQGSFVPPASAHHATIVAVCLREPNKFFGPDEGHGTGPIDVAQSQQLAGASNGQHPSSIDLVAHCPEGEAILGGGYESSLSTTGADWIVASYPAYENGIGEWHVTLHRGSSQAVSLHTYALCSGLFTTHLEHQALPSAPDKFGDQKGTDWMSCASGTLLTGGYNITESAAPDMMSGIDNDSPFDPKSRTPQSGDFVQRWYADPQWLGQLQGGSPGDIWVTCWDAPRSATPQATPSGSATTTITATAATATTPSPQPTSTPLPNPTATPKPLPTNTPLPQCAPFVNGSGAMDPNNFYLNVDAAAGIGHDPSVAQVQFSPASGAMMAINGALLADLGVIGAGGFNSLTCSQLKGASYGGGSAPVTNGEIFLVKTPGGHLAKVLVSVTPGSPFPTLR